MKSERPHWFSLIGKLICLVSGLNFGVWNCSSSVCFTQRGCRVVRPTPDIHSWKLVWGLEITAVAS